MFKILPKKRFAPRRSFWQWFKHHQKKILILAVLLIFVPALALIFWTNFRYLWFKRASNFYQNEATNFTFFYPRGFNLFDLKELQLRNKEFVAGFKKADRDSIACGVIEKERPSGYNWNPKKELAASLKAVGGAQEDFKKIFADVIRTKYGSAIFIDHTYQYDPQTTARNQQVAFPTKDKFYFLTCGGPADVFDDYRYGFELFFKTFRVKD